MDDRLVYTAIVTTISILSTNLTLTWLSTIDSINFCSYDLINHWRPAHLAVTSWTC